MFLLIGIATTHIPELGFRAAVLRRQGVRYSPLDFT